MRFTNEKIHDFFNRHNLNWEKVCYILQMEKKDIRMCLTGAGQTKRLPYETIVKISSFIGMMESRNIVWPDWADREDRHSDMVLWVKGLRYDLEEETKANLNACEDILFAILESENVLITFI